MKRRDLVKLGGAAALGSAMGSAALAQATAPADPRFTEWGWPQPYEKVSEKSIAWMKGKGWWPLQTGSQPAFTSMPVAVPKGFMKARGLEVEVKAFLSGPAINEAAAAGRIQAGLEGNLPFTSLIANESPIRCIAAVNPVLKHATLVPLNSPLKSLADVKGMSPKPAFGIVTGSSAEFYFQEALRSHGLEVGRDLTLKSLTPPDLLLMPEGLAGVIQWVPYVWDHLDFRKNARQIDAIFPYNMYMGNLWIHKEIIDNAPDVVQALMDAYAEGVLYSRYNPADAIKITQQDAMHKRFPPEIVERIVTRLNNLHKPTWWYPFRDLWSKENARVAEWLTKSGRLRKPVTEQLYASYFDTRFADATFAKLGWKIPSAPPWIAPDWSGKIGQIPYPPYRNEDTLKQPQSFPEAGDLVKPWYFAGKTYPA